MWYAKPRGGYAVDSVEARANYTESANILTSEGWTLEAISGALGNSFYEGGMNPWRWQSDTVTLSGGCGLFQFTPASRYLDDYAEHMNMSTSEVTAGARADEGAVQIRTMSSGAWGWIASLWRTYWNPDTIPDLYAYRNEVLARWGIDNRVPLSRYKTITNVRDATYAFYAGFEGPGTASMERFNQRAETAQLIYEYLGGQPIDFDPIIPILYLTKLLK